MHLVGEAMHGRGFRADVGLGGLTRFGDVMTPADSASPPPRHVPIRKQVDFAVAAGLVARSFGDAACSITSLSLDFAFVRVLFFFQSFCVLCVIVSC